MKKLIYITIHQFENKESDGVAKKILQQIMAFKNLGYQVTYTGHDGKDVFIKNDFVNHRSKRKLFIAKRTNVYKNTVKYLKNNNFDTAYIRGLSCDIGFLKVLKVLQENNTKIIIEIPTYPREIPNYKQNGVLGVILYKWDEILNRFLYRFNIDRFLVVGDTVSTLFGKPAYNILNGINVEQYSIREYPSNNELHVVAVAHVNNKHGYDRFIMGLRDYYINENSIKRKVYFHVVGSGTDELQNLVAENNLQDFVLFHGVLGGDKLEKILNNCQIALGALAIHRCNLTKGSILKVKEYCARGIPFVISYEEEKLEEEVFYLKVPATNESIDINKVIEFEERCCVNNKEIINRMRIVAEEKFKWEIIMQEHLTIKDNKRENI